jgi:hypothetical protein
MHSRLLEGSSSLASSLKPAAVALLSTSSKSRMPHSALRPFKFSSNAALDSAAYVYVQHAECVRTSVC